MSQVNTSLADSDPEIFDIVEKEKNRQVRAPSYVAHQQRRSLMIARPRWRDCFCACADDWPATHPLRGARVPLSVTTCCALLPAPTLAWL